MRRKTLKKNKEHSLEYSNSGTPMAALQPGYNGYDYGVVENEYTEIQILEYEESSAPPVDSKGKYKMSPDYKILDSKGKRKKGFGWRKKCDEEEEVLVDSHLKDKQTPTDILLDSGAKELEIGTPIKDKDRAKTDLKEEKKRGFKGGDKG